jgi:hypothetical protein
MFMFLDDGHSAIPGSLLSSYRFKANYSANIIGSIMQTRPTKLLIWQLINKERRLKYHR